MYHPTVIEEWKLNPDRAAYKKKFYAKEIIHTEKKKFDRHDSREFWTNIIIEYMQWFIFQYIMLHKADNIKHPGYHLQ